MTILVDRLPEALWQRVQPLLPAPPPRPRGKVPRRVPDRNCVAALVFMARTSTPWRLLPAKELGCGSATTCWRWLDNWARAGVFDQLQAGAAGRARHRRPDRPGAGQGGLLQSAGGQRGDLTGATPVDRGTHGSKPDRDPAFSQPLTTHELPYGSTEPEAVACWRERGHSETAWHALVRQSAQPAGIGRLMMPTDLSRVLTRNW
jgi:transposase